MRNPTPTTITITGKAPNQTGPDTMTTLTRPTGTKAERMLTGFDRGFCQYVYSDPTDRHDMYRAARAAQRASRRIFGFKGNAAVLTAPEAQPKLGKSTTPSYGFMLLPSDGITAHSEAGIRGVNLCPKASAGCRAGCLSTAGKGAMDATQRARAARTAFLLTDAYSTGIIIAHELTHAIAKHGRILFRPNTVADIRWESVAPGMLAWVAENHDTIRVYDYTAWSPQDRASRPHHYAMTYSHKDSHNIADSARMVADGHNVAVVVNVKRGHALPSTWFGLPVVDGDKSDDRTQDPAGSWVMLRAKGQAIGDTSGFVVDIAAGMIDAEIREILRNC